MKNLKVVILLALGVTLFTSCKKKSNSSNNEYECACVDPATGRFGEVSKVNAPSIEAAQPTCDAKSPGNKCTVMISFED